MRFALSLAFSLALSPLASAQTTLVNTTSGPVQGVLEGGVLRWRAIPYAEPPLGNLRWRRPVPKATSATTLDATVNGPGCPYRVGLTTQGCDVGTTGSIPGNEDCLSLYVWRPENPSELPMPVMVFIHGGGLSQGCAKSPSTDGAGMALSQNVLVVSIQYRLGALGFFGLPELAAEDPSGSTGNYGFMDQLLALQWVQDNAAAFGGDPANVTIFGESAGGVSVCVLLASPQSSGLFERAIVESGGCKSARPLDTTPGSPVDGKTIYQRSQTVASLVNCPAGPDQLTCLRQNTPAAALVQALASLPGGLGLPPADPALDGYVLPEQPLVLLRQGAADGRPLLVGSNANEMTAFTIGLENQMGTAAAYEQRVRTELGNTIADLLLPLYPAASYPSPAEAYRTLYEDSGFVCPTLAMADAATQGGSAAYVYHLRFPPTYPLFGFFAFLKTFHGIDLNYIFGTLTELNTSFGIQLDADDTAVSDSMQGAWAAFARTGAPAASPAWPVYAPTTLGQLAGTEVYLFDAPNTTVSGSSFRSGRCELLVPVAALLDPDEDNTIYTLDNCPTVANTAQRDEDGDLVGQSCDTCPGVANPRVASPASWMTRVSGQRDDDADGLGNRCDFDHDQLGPVITAGDFNLAKASVGKLASSSTCGAAGTLACGRFDQDETGPVIVATDFNLMKAQVGKVKPASCGSACTRPFGTAAAPRMGKATCEGPNC